MSALALRWAWRAIKGLPFAFLALAAAAFVYFTVPGAGGWWHAFRVDEGPPLGYVAGASVLQVLCRMPDGTKADALSNQAANTAAAIGPPSVRVAPHFHLPPGVRGPAGNVIGIEVGLPDDLARPVLPATAFSRPVVRRFAGALPVAVGVAPDGGPVVRDLALFPHLLVGGQTGGGESVFTHSLILQLILRLPSDRRRLRLADPKAVELSFYRDLPHVDGKVVSTLEDTMALVNAAVEEMENRYALLKAARARDIAGYNAAAAKDGTAPPPHIVLVVDEFADLTAQGKAREAFEGGVQRLAQKARAAGVHLVLTTVRLGAHALAFAGLGFHLPCLPHQQAAHCD